MKFYDKGCLLSKADIENSFKIIPIHPDDHELFGFPLGDQYLFDKTLPMGLSFSCKLFETFSTAVHWIIDHKLGVSGCVHFLDDFLFEGPANSPLCLQTLENFLTMSKQIGLPIKADKTVFPTTTLTFLGLELDSELIEIRLPLDKLGKLKDQLNHFKFKKKATLRELQSLIGLLNFACSVVPPGRAFLRRLIDLTIGLSKPHHHRRLNKETRSDIQAWLIFVESFNGKCLFLSDRWGTSEQLNLYTDASNIGFGGLFRKHWFAIKWPTDWLKYHITIREFFPIVVAIQLWGNALSNKCVTFFTDNSGVVHIINKQSSKDPTIMKLVRKFDVLTLQFNNLFKAVHIPGIKNTAADHLSRLQIQKFREEFPLMSPLPIVNSVDIPQL
jgi:hypothetical protein